MSLIQLLKFKTREMRHFKLPHFETPHFQMGKRVTGSAFGQYVCGQVRIKKLIGTCLSRKLTNL